MDFKQASELRYSNTPVQEFTTPMVYAKKIEPAGIDFIIAQGSHDGLNYYVKNIECRHPTAYIEIPQGHKAYNMDFNNWEYNLIDVHGGVTYQSGSLHCVDRRRGVVRYNVPYRLDDFDLRRPPQSWQYVEDPAPTPAHRKPRAPRGG